MDPTIAVLVGIITNFVSFEVGNRLMGKNKVSEASCAERRGNCTEKFCIQLDAIHEKLDDLSLTVKNNRRGCDNA